MDIFTIILFCICLSMIGNALHDIYKNIKERIRRMDIYNMKQTIEMCEMLEDGETISETSYSNDGLGYMVVLSNGKSFEFFVKGS